MKRKQNRKRTQKEKAQTTVIYQPMQTGFTCTFRELAMRNSIYGIGGSTSFTDFQNQIFNVRDMATLVAFGR